jgi:hypothetical protein
VSFASANNASERCVYVNGTYERSFVDRLQNWRFERLFRGFYRDDAGANFSLIVDDSPEDRTV